MGYDVHVTRADEWWDSASDPITAEEWLALVEADIELHIAGDNGPYFATWRGPGSYPDPSWFDWNEGRIYTKHPRRRELAKLLQIARSLNARVQGDEGEFYNVIEDMASDEEFGAVDRPWWKFWRP